MISEYIKKSKKIVIKIGSNTLADQNGWINQAVVENLSQQVNELIQSGKQVVIVSSGARISGVATLGKWSRKEDMSYKQALCAIGQVELMNAYRKAFDDYDIHIGQILLTRDDFNHENRKLNIRNTLFTLVDEGVIPIINENDTVSFEELKIGDNDELAALAATLWNADLLIMLSDIDGVYDKNPKEHQNAKLIERIEDVIHEKLEIEEGRKNDFGTGGIHTKIEAAKKVNQYDIPMILTNGKKTNSIVNLKEEKTKATLFVPKNR